MEVSSQNGAAMNQETIIRELYATFANTNGVTAAVAKDVLADVHKELGSVVKEEAFPSLLEAMLIQASLAALIKAVRANMPASFPTSKPYDVAISQMRQRAASLQRPPTL